MSKSLSSTQSVIRCAGAVFLLAVFAVWSAPRASAQSENVLLSLPGGVDGSQPHGPLAEDSAGNLYGTTFAGGAHGFGAVIKLSLVSGVWQETVLHSFTGGHDGANPYASVLLGADGKLYGTTGFGGKSGACGGGGCGVVFELSPVGGGWVETVLHAFSGGADGAIPQGLALDSHGNIFGLAETGGTSQACNQLVGCGTAFELSVQSAGGWKFGVIHIFSGGSDGGTPSLRASPLVDAGGNVYGATFAGGNAKFCSNTFPNVVGCGVAFRLSPVAGGGWSEKVLYRFFGFADGAFPTGGLVMDSSGNLYGAASAGGDTRSKNCAGDYGCGVIFQLTPTSSGLWKAAPLHTFESTDGLSPLALAFDHSGNLYGPTGGGGDAVCNCGTVFELAAGAGGWTFSTLHAFVGGTDGRFPTGVMLDSSGNVFGPTSSGGSAGDGTFYEITP